MKSVRLTTRARTDLFKLIEYLYPPRALELVDAYESVIRDLSDHPDLGTPWDRRGTRVLRRGGYRFFYKEEPDHVDLLRILDPRSGRLTS